MTPPPPPPLTNATAIGYRARVTQSNSLVLGGTGVNAVNVGIGTTTPTARLTISKPSVPVYGNINFFPDNPTNDILFDGGSDSIFSFRNTGASTGRTLFANPDGSERLTILNNGGNVGIGTSTPGNTLTVNGTAWVTSGNWSGSDIRWKKDIAPLQNSLDEVMQLKPVSFNWRKDEFPTLRFNDGRQLGLTAQEVEKVIPELVSTNPEGYKGISYEKLTPVLVSAIQEQQKQIKDLRAEVAELKKEIKK